MARRVFGNTLQRARQDQDNAEKRQAGAGPTLLAQRLFSKTIFKRAFSKSRLHHPGQRSIAFRYRVAAISPEISLANAALFSTDTIVLSAH
jgi:hypothetical protein